MQSITKINAEKGVEWEEKQSVITEKVGSIIDKNLELLGRIFDWNPIMCNPSTT